MDAVLPITLKCSICLLSFFFFLLPLSFPLFLLDFSNEVLFRKLEDKKKKKKLKKKLLGFFFLVCVWPKHKPLPIFFICFRVLKDGTLQENEVTEGSRLVLCPNMESGTSVSTSLFFFFPSIPHAQAADGANRLAPEPASPAMMQPGYYRGCCLSFMPLTGAERENEE